MWLGRGVVCHGAGFGDHLHIGYVHGAVHAVGVCGRGGVLGGRGVRVGTVAGRVVIGTGCGVGNGAGDTNGMPNVRLEILGSDQLDGVRARGLRAGLVVALRAGLTGLAWLAGGRVVGRACGGLIVGHQDVLAVTFRDAARHCGFLAGGVAARGSRIALGIAIRGLGGSAGVVWSLSESWRRAEGQHCAEQRKILHEVSP